MNAETLPAVAGQVEPSVRPDDEACECRECDGQGGYDAWKAVAGHYEGGKYLRVECDHCDGTVQGLSNYCEATSKIISVDLLSPWFATVTYN